MGTKNLKKSELRHNIIRELYYCGSLSLTELSESTHKSLPLVNSCVEELIEEGYILDNGLAPSTGGRRPQTYLLNHKKERYILAVSIDQLEARMAIYDLSNVSVTLKMENLFINIETENSIDSITEFIRDYIERSEIPEQHFIGIGVAMPGFVDVEKGMNYSFLKLENITLKDYWERIFGIPVYIDNDSSAIAMAELKFGSAKGLQDVMVVNIGWGIGLGMIVNGHLFRGHRGFAGEFSHIPLSKTDHLCSCGKRGCLEVDASLLIIAGKAEQAIKDGEKSSMEKLFQDNKKLPGDQLIQAAKHGDPLAVSILSESAFMIGKGIATLIHIMNPEKIILSGRGAIAGRVLLAPVHQAINEFCIPWLAEQTTIDISTLTSDAALLGAVTLVVENGEFQ